MARPIKEGLDYFPYKRTEGTQIIKYDWDRIKNSTDKYNISKMSIKIFRYKIIED